VGDQFFDPLADLLLVAAFVLAALADFVLASLNALAKFLVAPGTVRSIPRPRLMAPIAFSNSMAFCNAGSLNAAAKLGMRARLAATVLNAPPGPPKPPALMPNPKPALKAALNAAFALAAALS
jgi:hypothetical protein